MVKQSTETCKAVIIGLANSGKTQIFNQLTGDYNLIHIDGKSGEIGYNEQGKERGSGERVFGPTV